MATSEKSRSVLKAHFAAIQEEIAEIEARTTPLREKRDALMAKIQPFEDEARELAKQIMAIERPVLPELKQELSDLARAMGGKRLSEGPAQSE